MDEKFNTILSIVLIPQIVSLIVEKDKLMKSPLLTNFINLRFMIY